LQTELTSRRPVRADLLILSLAPIFLDVGFLQVAISAWLPTVGISPFQVGLLITAQGVMVVLSSLPLGVLSDI
jgi:MFS family permease